MNRSESLRTIFLAIPIVMLALSPIAVAQQAGDSKMANGVIIITSFEGDVKISSTTNEEAHSPKKGAVLKQGQIVVTGPNSKASLAFENGIVMEIAPSTKFVIQEFQQAPWDVAPDKLQEMKTEPSQSKTTGYLEYGDVITGVKKLKTGSNLNIGTPLGSAGIRGTDFKTSSVNNPDGSPKRFTVGVASGEVGVRSAGGTETVPVPAGTASTVSVNPSQAGQTATITPPTTSQLSAETGSSILTSVSAQRSSGQAVFSQALLAATQNRQTALAALTPEQRKTLEDASKKGDVAVVDAVKTLVTETPTSAPQIAAAAAELAPAVAPQIATVAAIASPSLAARIAAAVSSTVPSSATAIASSVAKAVPSAAAAIAGAVARVTPTQAPQIAVAVSIAAPEAVVQIAQSVAAAQPQLASQITSQIVQSVPGVNSQAVGDAVQSAVPQSSNTGNGVQPPPPNNTGTSVQPPPRPTVSPTPAPTPLPTQTPVPSQR